MTDILIDFVTKNFASIMLGLATLVGGAGVFKNQISQWITSRKALATSRREQILLASIPEHENPNEYLPSMERSATAKMILGQGVGVAELEQISNRKALDPLTIISLRDTLAKHDPSHPVFQDILKLLCANA